MVLPGVSSIQMTQVGLTSEMVQSSTVMLTSAVGLFGCVSQQGHWCSLGAQNHHLHAVKMSGSSAV